MEASGWHWDISISCFFVFETRLLAELSAYIFTKLTAMDLPFSALPPVLELQGLA